MAPVKTALCSLLLLGLQEAASALRFSSNGTTPPYKDPNNPVEVRVDDLLGRMTIEDKMSQLMQGIYSYVLFYQVSTAKFGEGNGTVAMTGADWFYY